MKKRSAELLVYEIGGSVSLTKRRFTNQHVNVIAIVVHLSFLH